MFFFPAKQGRIEPVGKRKIGELLNLEVELQKRITGNRRYSGKGLWKGLWQ
jgi:hypothetical protein